MQDKENEFKPNDRVLNLPFSDFILVVLSEEDLPLILFRDKRDFMAVTVTDGSQNRVEPCEDTWRLPVGEYLVALSLNSQTYSAKPKALCLKLQATNMGLRMEPVEPDEDPPFLGEDPARLWVQVSSDGPHLRRLQPSNPLSSDHAKPES